MIEPDAGQAFEMFAGQEDARRDEVGVEAGVDGMGQNRIEIAPRDEAHVEGRAREAIPFAGRAPGDRTGGGGAAMKAVLDGDDQGDGGNEDRREGDDQVEPRPSGPVRCRWPCIRS